VSLEIMMAAIRVDDRDYEVKATDNLLQACLSLGLDIPYFCWHPALGSVGACRQCAVKQFHDENDRTGRVVMSCMTPAADGTRLSLLDAEVAAFRASVIEWLMTNHPHDCPVCEEGGECHLQDMTLMTGHTYRRYRFRKRTFRNQYLGPFVKHEMNRCIACYRCVRFYGDYAGGRDLDVFGAHNQVYFGRDQDGVLESEFSGNLVEVCPTGVFTDKPFSANYVRKWDLKGTASVCPHCGVGCNTILNARDGQVRRTLNRFNAEVNRYFLCDRGRFGYDYANSRTRLRLPLIARDGVAEAVSRETALGRVATMLRDDNAIGIGSPRASLESNFALRTLVGPQHFHLGVSDLEYSLLKVTLDVLQHGAAPVASLRDAEESDAVLILGDNVPDTAPRLALTLRQALHLAAVELAARQKIPAWQDAAVRDAGRGHRKPLIIATSDATRLDEVASATYRCAPDDIARLGFAVAHALDPSVPPVPGPALHVEAAGIADVLRNAERPLVVTGTGHGNAATIRAAGHVADALRKQGRAARIIVTVPECNSIGLALIGGAPLSEALQALKTGAARSAIVLENDLFRHASFKSVEDALNAAEHVVVLDSVDSETVHHAHVFLPAAAFGEAGGTLVNYEGRAQRFFPVVLPDDAVTASWRWLNEAACDAGRSNARWDSLDQAIAAFCDEVPGLAAMREAAPDSDFRVVGNRVANAPHRFSGRTALHADRRVQEPITKPGPDAPYSNSMEGYYGDMPGALFPYFWAPAWNSVQSVNKFQQEIGSFLRHGPVGVRLIAPQGNGSVVSADEIPPPFSRRAGEWLVVPRSHVFGSDELSALAPAVAERIPSPTIGLNAEDAAAVNIVAGETAQVSIGEESLTANAEIRPSLPRGVAALDVGLPGTQAYQLPAWATICRVGSAGVRA
jgi:NADH-quinone oxidoreductase subunit G